MKIGKIPGQGQAFELNKWQIGIEILKCPPYMYGVFRPYIFILCVKVSDPGEPYKINGRPEIKKGGWWQFTFPYGIKIEIIR